MDRSEFGPHEKTPLLPSSSQDDEPLPVEREVPEVVEFDINNKFQKYKFHILGLLALLLVIHVLEFTSPTDRFPWPLPLNPPRPPTPPKSLHPEWHSKLHTFKVNTDNSHYNHKIEINETLYRDHFPGTISGEVKFLTGEEHQGKDFVIYVLASSPEESLVNQVLLSNSTDPGRSETLFVTSIPDAASEEPHVKESPPLELTIYIYASPDAFQFGRFQVYTANLDITFGEWAYFETYHMTLEALHGNIHSPMQANYLIYFTAHEMVVTAHHGSITGNWSLPSSVRMYAPEKHIDIGLYPKRWSSGPYTSGTTKLYSKGDITIRMPTDADKLSLRNSTTEIVSSHGNVRATLVTGAITNITASKGSIDADLMPYWGEYASRWFRPDFDPKILTYSAADTKLSVQEPVIDSYLKTNPMNKTISTHKAGGSVQVHYPKAWAGVVEVRSANGRASLKGEGVETNQVDEHVIKGKRGVGESRVTVEAGSDAEAVFEG